MTLCSAGACLKSVSHMSLSQRTCWTQCQRFSAVNAKNVANILVSLTADVLCLPPGQVCFGLSFIFFDPAWTMSQFKVFGVTNAKIISA